MADYIYVKREHGAMFGLPTMKHKVGISKHPLKRRRQLQTGNADDLVIVDVIRIRGRSRARRVESRVHLWLEPLRIPNKREWFWFTPFPSFLLPAIVRLAKWTTL